MGALSLICKRVPQRLRGQSEVNLKSSSSYMPAISLRSSALVLGLLAGANAAMGQATVSPLGGEYAIVEPVPGDQVLPSISLSQSGGVLIWQDNSINGPTRGWGHGGSLMTAQGGAIGNTYRVNSVKTGDHLAPQVQLLANNKAVYVWYSKVAGSFDVYARLSEPAKNESTLGTNFYTADVRVNTYVPDSQMNPAVAALPDGNAIITWQSYGQDKSMFGVYARKILTTGAKRFATPKEFLVNQFTAYNQRNPAVTALQDGSGGYVITWISEREKSAEGVDVYARVFSSSGEPVTDEFAVDSAAGDCSSPSVAALPDGSFTVVWNQRDMEVATNGYDIWGRNFSTSGNPTGADFRVNTYLYGDQYGAKIASGPSGSMVVWTSMAQDGSQEGVFGRFLAGGTQPSGDEFRVNTTTVSKQMHPAVAWNGVDRFLVVWTSFTGSTGFDIYGQAYTLNQ